MDGDQIVPSAEIRKKIGMATTRNNYNRKTTSARNLDAPSKVPSDFELPKTPKLTEAQPIDTN